MVEEDFSEVVGMETVVGVYLAGEFERYAMLNKAKTDRLEQTSRHGRRYNKGSSYRRCNHISSSTNSRRSYRSTANRKSIPTHLREARD